MEPLTAEEITAAIDRVTDYFDRYCTTGADCPMPHKSWHAVHTALLAARREERALRDAADARFAIYGRLLRGVQRTINGDDVQDHQLRAAIRALIGKMADEFAAMQPWDPDALKIVQSAALAATPEER